MARSRPWLFVTLPRLFTRYEACIAQLRAGAGHDAIELHDALLQTFRGRARVYTVGFLSSRCRRAWDWILAPFAHARRAIDSAPPGAVHARIDVLTSRAVAFARAGRCQDCLVDLDEIDRLILVLANRRRQAYWNKQRAAILRQCEGPE